MGKDIYIYEVKRTIDRAHELLRFLLSFLWVLPIIWLVFHSLTQVTRRCAAMYTCSKLTCSCDICGALFLFLCVVTLLLVCVQVDPLLTVNVTDMIVHVITSSSTLLCLILLQVTKSWYESLVELIFTWLLWVVEIVGDVLDMSMLLQRMSKWAIETLVLYTNCGKALSI